MKNTSLADEAARYYGSLASVYHKRSGYSAKGDETGVLEQRIQSLFTNRRVLEIACGTGYWTGVLSRFAESVLATDINQSMLAEAKRNCSGCSNVQFLQADAYSLRGVPGGFTGAFSVLWWCHMPVDRIRSFLLALHGKLLPGAKVLHVCQLEDMDASDHVSDPMGNTIARRSYGDREYRIVKNVPSEEDLKRVLLPLRGEMEYSVHTELGLWSVEYVPQGLPPG